MDILDNIKKHIEAAEQKENRQYGQEVPEGYFDSLESKLETLIPKEKDKRIIFPLWTLGAIAASVCLVLVAVFTFNTDEISMEQPLALHEISAEESVQFLLSVNDRLDNEDLLEIENIDEILEELKEEIENQTN